MQQLIPSCVPAFATPHRPPSRASTRSRSPQLLLRLLVAVRDKPVQETARLALCPAVLLGLGEFLLEVLLGFFLGLLVVVVIRWERQSV